MTRSVDERLIRNAAGSVEGLLTLLVEGLDWPLPAHLESIPLLEWSPEELGLDPSRLGRLTAIRQIPKLSAKQPFGVFVLTFDGGRLPIGALRRVVGQVVRKHRRRRSAADSQWDLGDLVFFCHNDDGHGSVHVVALRDAGGKQDIRTISWTADPTPTRMALLSVHALPDLFWPDSGVLVDEWRSQWRSAFTAGYREGVKTAAALSQRMAEVATDIRHEIADLLAVETQDGALHGLLRDIRATLDAASDESKFADMFAQTLVYGLLSARVSHPDQFRAAEANTLVDFENPFLDAIYGRFRDLAEDSLDLDHLGLTDLAHTLAATNVDALLADFGTRDRKEDPVIYLYESFLDLYDKDQRRRLGAYYTPVPVVYTMVRLVDEIISSRLSLPEGIADTTTWRQWFADHPESGIPDGVDQDMPVISMLDPATGTGTFLLEWLRRIREHEGTDVRSALSRMAAIELSLASYSVAHLKAGLELPPHIRAQVRLPIYLGDTLAGRRPDFLIGMDDPIAAETLLADFEKFDRRHSVIIGNPPYQRLARTDGGGWLTNPQAGEPRILEDILAPARAHTIFSTQRSLYNLYVYFWRWSVWKAFEQSSTGPAIVALITASSWLDGPGFLGLRALARREADDIWIIDLGGDNKGARLDENIFGIETPVAIAILVRRGAPQRDTPANVHYRLLLGTKEQKLSALSEVGLSPADWSSSREDMYAPIRPRAGGADWAALPRLTDLLPWQQPGCIVGRTWPVSVVADLLPLRWRRLLAEPSSEKRAELFVTARTGRSINTQVMGLPKLADLPSDTDCPPLSGYAFRSFDSQQVIQDPRVFTLDRPSLWASLSNQQMFMVSAPTTVLGNGPAATVATSVPDFHYFNGRGGKDVLPLFRDASLTPNMDLRALAVLRERLQPSDPEIVSVTPVNLFSYCYGVLAGADYTDRFKLELATPGPRIPITADAVLFTTMAGHGRRLLWLHTRAQRFSDEFGEELVIGSAIQWATEPTFIPATASEIRYDALTGILTVGGGQLRGVSPEIWGYEVSGMPVLRKWLGYRTAKGTGRAAASKNPLEEIRPEHWYPDWTAELRSLVHVLTETLEITSVGVGLLDQILDNELVAASEFPEPAASLREPPRISPHKGGGLF